ncbi:SDR family oxidoreductase [Granulicella cerasi]|uniref:SDR family oxidoreductase n=1 Tax=Granulicella cerasi TaxID=741063 RepID=A0ABW1ZFZ6_9BACT|nr:SDR family oxidoreductase [Granulicella cerasi]
MEMQVMKGRVALVTGATSGLGFASAKRLIEEGAHVYVTGLDDKALAETQERLGPSATAILADSGVKKDMKHVAEEIKRAHGKLDFLQVNAGRLAHNMPLPELTEEEIDRTFDTNFKGVIFTVQTMLDVLRDGASIVLTSSVTVDMGLKGFAHYAGTKAAARAFAKAWTTELKDRNIRVNSISPGIVPTEGFHTEQGMSKEQIADYSAKVSKDIPAGRVGKVEDIANAVLFLASDASDYIRGIDLVVDGGLTEVYAGKNGE